MVVGAGSPRALIPVISLVKVIDPQGMPLNEELVTGEERG